MKWFCLAFAFLVFMTACVPLSENPNNPSTATFTSIPTSTSTPTPAQIIQYTSTAQPIVSTTTPVPLQILFPTPQSEPKSIWRPPLYQPPFSLGPHDHFYFSRPIAVNEVNWPLADYRYGYIFPETDSVHTGIDIDAPLGTPIIAAASGIVTWAGIGLLKHDSDPKDPYGMAVAIRHDFGYKGQRLVTVYAHMSRVDIKVGQVVSQGEQLGLVGMTGFTTGPHVHFEVRLESEAYFTSRNPELWLSPPEGDGLIVGHFQNGYGGNLGAYKVTVITPDDEYLTGYTYGPYSVNSDDYYQENFVQSDLPAGKYTVEFTYWWKKYSQTIEVFPGMISYFTFQGRSGFSLLKPSTEANPEWLIPVSKP